MAQKSHSSAGPKPSFDNTFDPAAGVTQMLDMWRLMAQAFTPNAAVAAAWSRAAANSGRAGHDPAALLMQTNAMFAASAARFWLRWQALYAAHAPVLSRALADYAANGQRDDSTAAQFIDQVRAYLRENAELADDQHRLLRQDIEAIEAQLFADSRFEQARRHTSAKA